MPVTYHMVLPGETLFEIAAAVDPAADVRDTAVRIARLNALDSWGLQAGQRLALPVEPCPAGGRVPTHRASDGTDRQSGGVPHCVAGAG